MEKALAVFLTLFISIISVFCLQFTTNAVNYKPDKKIYAKAYMLINLDDESYPVVAEKNSDKKLYPASLTKIVTAMVTINKVGDLNEKVKMSQNVYNSLLGTGAQVAGIEVGEELTVDKLLYLTMVHSACDASRLLAQYVSSSIDAFAQEMNRYVKSLGCNNTHFVNPDGLHDDNHYTTARDMAKITLCALKNPDFVKYSTATEVAYKDMTLGHTNLMLNKGYLTYYYEYAQGIKTGSTPQAEYCLITKASKGSYNYLAIVMKSPQKEINGESYPTKCSFVDAKSLFEWAFDSLKYKKIVSKDEILDEISVKDGKDFDSVKLSAKIDSNIIVPSSLKKTDITIKVIEKPEAVNAPVVKGQNICKAKITYGGETLATVELVAANDVELSTVVKILSALKNFFWLNRC